MDGTQITFPCNSREHAIEEQEAIATTMHDWTAIRVRSMRSSRGPLSHQSETD